MQWHIEPHGTVSSTMEIAARHATRGAPAGLVIVAEEQTTGRGRLGRVWLAPSGTSLLFTALFRLYHQSSHVGDEFLLRNRVANRVNLSYEAVDVKASYELLEMFRVYAGFGYLFDQEPPDQPAGSWPIRVS